MKGEVTRLSLGRALLMGVRRLFFVLVTFTIFIIEINVEEAVFQEVLRDAGNVRCFLPAFFLRIASVSRILQFAFVANATFDLGLASLPLRVVPLLLGVTGLRQLGVRITFRYVFTTYEIHIQNYYKKYLNKVISGQDFQKKWYLANLAKWHTSRRLS